MGRGWRAENLRSPRALTQNDTMKRYFVYILSSRSRRLYIGVTNDLERRVFEHKNKFVEGFARKYNIDRLVYFEEFGDIREAITREKQLKGWLREKKIALIEGSNPSWRDLGQERFDGSRALSERNLQTE